MYFSLDVYGLNYNKKFVDKTRLRVEIFGTEIKHVILAVDNLQHYKVKTKFTTSSDV